MRRRLGVVDSESPRKRIRTISETLNLPTTIEVDNPLPYGEILTDVTQKPWRIGKPIGRGSFGEIYLASDNVDEEVTSENSRYVIKIEPHSNGPLFVEIHCLIRSARHDKIKKWKKERHLKSLGMPHYIANGSHLFEDVRYRFLVLPRYDCDIEKILCSSKVRRIDSKNVLVLASQMIDVLEYLHLNGYAHSDIKSSNLMVGFDGSSLEDQNVSLDKNLNVEESKKSPSKTLKHKQRYGSYYYDEDFVLHNYLSSTSNTDHETDEDSDFGRKRVKNSKVRKVSQRFTKLPSISKNTPMKRLFNLRKLKSDVNYEDFNSSICSYDSYQELLDSNKDLEPKAASTDDSNEYDVDHFQESIKTQSAGQAYLLDFGLASKFLNSDGSHKEFEMDQRKAHDGTLEYSSRDSHIGAHSRRSDLENLGYNLIDWLTGSLPWKTPETLTDPELVHALKKNYMFDVQRFMEVCFKSHNYPKFIEKYFVYLNKLEFSEKPNYRYCKSLFIDEFIAEGFGTEKDMILNFNSKPPTIPRKRINYSKKCSGKNPAKNTPPDFLKRNAIVKVYGRENSHSHSWENDVKMDLIREGLSNEGVRKPCVSRNFYVSDADLISKLRQTLLINHETPSKKFSPKNLRSTKKIIKKRKGARNARSNIGKFGNFLGSDKQYTWAEILAGNPESIIRKEKGITVTDNPTEGGKNGGKKLNRKGSNASEISVANFESNNTSPILLKSDYLSSLNPTYAMKEVVANYKRKIAGKPALKMKIPDGLTNIESYTPSMIKVYRSMEKNRKKERQVEEKSTRTIRSKTDTTPEKKISTSPRKNSIKKTLNTIPSSDEPPVKKSKTASKSPQKNTLSLKRVQSKAVKAVQPLEVIPVRRLRQRNPGNQDTAKISNSVEIEQSEEQKSKGKNLRITKVPRKEQTKILRSKLCSSPDILEPVKSNQIRTRSKGKRK